MEDKLSSMPLDEIKLIVSGFKQMERRSLSSPDPLFLARLAADGSETPVMEAIGNQVFRLNSEQVMAMKKFVIGIRQSLTTSEQPIPLASPTLYLEEPSRSYIRLISNVVMWYHGIYLKENVRERQNLLKEFDGSVLEIGFKNRVRHELKNLAMSLVQPNF